MTKRRRVRLLAAPLLVASALAAVGTDCGPGERADETRASTAAGTSAAAPDRAATGSAATDSAAIGCARLDTPPPESSSEPDPPLESPARFACRIRAGEPPFAVVLVPGPGGYAVLMRVFAPADTTRPLQVMDVSEFSDVLQPTLYTEDLDSDGWGDLHLLHTAGVFNKGYTVWLYDAARRRFVRSADLSELTNPEPIRGRPGHPCVRTYWRDGHMAYTRSEYCREGGRWVEVRREHQDVHSGVYLRITHERRGDTLVEVRRDTVREPDR